MFIFFYGFFLVSLLFFLDKQNINQKCNKFKWFFFGVIYSCTHTQSEALEYSTTKKNVCGFCLYDWCLIKGETIYEKYLHFFCYIVGLYIWVPYALHFNYGNYFRCQTSQKSGKCCIKIYCESLREYFCLLRSQLVNGCYCFQNKILEQMLVYILLQKFRYRKWVTYAPEK